VTENPQRMRNAMSDRNEEQHEERRNVDRRISALENQYKDLLIKVGQVGQEQLHQRELINARFAALERGQDHVSTQLSSLSQAIQMMAGDPDKTPAGRMMLREITTLAQHCADLDRTVDEQQRTLDELNGALKLVRAIGIGSLIGAAAGLVMALKALGVIG